MANLRDFKKEVNYVCEDLATDALIASQLFPEKIDFNRVNAIINEIAALQDDTFKLLKISFDKGRKEFATLREYRRARSAYFTTAFNKLKKDFVDRANAIIDQLNEAVPEEARKAVTK